MATIALVDDDENIITSVVENGAYVKEGDVILTLDSLYIDEQISERSKYAHWSRSGAEHWRATANYRQLKVAEYLEGRYVTQVMSKDLERVLKESALLADNKMLAFNMQQFEKGYVSKDRVDQLRRQIDKNVVDLDLLNTDLKVLKEHTKKSEMARLEGELKVAQAQFEASDERAEADASRRDRAVEEKAFCTILAPKDGLVIHPRAASWKWAPDIVIGGSVYKEQVLLLMPDLDQMQVKIGVEEEVIDNISVGMNSRLDTIQATILLEKLKTFTKELKRRKEVANLYLENITNIVIKPFVDENSDPIWSQFTIKTKKRDKLKAFLEENKIPTMIYYPIPLHKQKAYKKFRTLTNSLVNSEDACNQVISIPIHGYISNLEVDKVISYINKFFKNK